MALYFFDVHDGDRVVVDQVGTELSDDNVAREEATKTLSEIAAEEIPRDGPVRDFSITVLDHARTVLFELRLTFHARSF